jgi:hypothetical protein
MRFILGILATLGLIILILVLLFRGGGSSNKPKALYLPDYAHSGSTAQLVMQGPVVADQNYREVKIDVSSDDVVFTVYQGYEGDVLKTQSYVNNDSAYTVFLKSLQFSGFTLGDRSKNLEDVSGRCPTGQRSVYSFTNESDQLMKFWSTSCGQKTFNGSINVVSQLFRTQVPDYDTLIQNTDFNNSF